jgi:cytochrome c
MLVANQWSVFFGLLAIILGPYVTFAQDSEQGAALYQQQCSGCHSVEPNMHLAGPSLWGVVGREAGNSEAFDYSTALEEADTVWNRATLDSFLAAPSEFIPGTSKVVAVPDEQQRNDLIEYLQTLSE